MLLFDKKLLLPVFQIWVLCLFCGWAGDGETNELALKLKESRWKGKSKNFPNPSRRGCKISTELFLFNIFISAPSCFFWRIFCSLSFFTKTEFRVKFSSVSPAVRQWVSSGPGLPAITPHISLVLIIMQSLTIHTFLVTILVNFVEKHPKFWQLCHKDRAALKMFQIGKKISFVPLIPGSVLSSLSRQSEKAWLDIGYFVVFKSFKCKQ